MTLPTDVDLRTGDGGPLLQACEASVTATNGMSARSPCRVYAWGPDVLGNMNIWIANQDADVGGVTAIEFAGTRREIPPMQYHLGDFDVHEYLAVRFERSNPYSAFAPMGGKGEMTLRLDAYAPGLFPGEESPGTHGALDATLPGTLPGTSAVLHIGF